MKSGVFKCYLVCCFYFKFCTSNFRSFFVFTKKYISPAAIKEMIPTKTEINVFFVRKFLWLLVSEWKLAHYSCPFIQAPIKIPEIIILTTSIAIKNFTIYFSPLSYCCIYVYRHEIVSYKSLPFPNSYRLR